MKRHCTMKKKYSDYEIGGNKVYIVILSQVFDYVHEIILTSFWKNRKWINIEIKNTETILRTLNV